MLLHLLCLCCCQVPTGEYRLSALAAAPESASGLLFLPSHIDVVVKSPLLDVKFSQVNKYMDICLSIKYPYNAYNLERLFLLSLDLHMLSPIICI